MKESSENLKKDNKEFFKAQQKAIRFRASPTRTRKNAKYLFRRTVL